MGTLAGVGIGTTISLANPGTGVTEIFIPTKSIYIKNHNLNTGDQVTYSSNSGSGLIVLESDGVGIGTTLPYLTNSICRKTQRRLDWSCNS